MENKNEGQFRLGTREQSALLFYTKSYKPLCYNRYCKSTQVINTKNTKKKNLIGFYNTPVQYVSPTTFSAFLDQINTHQL